MIRAVFFDYGGVLARFDEAGIRALEADLGLADDDFFRAMYWIPEWEQAQVDAIDEAVWREAVDRKLEEMSGRPLPGIRERWTGVSSEIDRDVVALVETLKPAYRVGVLSNSTLRLEDELLAPHGLLDMWHVIINSARERVAKPDERIYRMAAERIGVAPEECVHIDDLRHNIEGARAAGFQAVHHQGDFAALEASLRDLGVTW